MRLKKTIAALLVLLLAISAPAYAAYNMPYYIGVDLTNQIVTIYRTEDDTIVRQMLTSSGMNDSTPVGTFYMEEKGRVSERGEWTWYQQYHCWVKYSSRIYHGYMFHSLPFEKKDESTMMEEPLKEFGTPTSHGCMRLRVDDARFIAKECLQGTKVVIYKGDTVDEELRQLLLVSSYNADDGLKYTEFLGYSEDALGRGAAGTDVRDLQHRLVDLGYFDSEPNGHYDNDTIVAVKHVQNDLGMAQSGVATGDLLAILYSEDAPVSVGQTTLQEGSSGPVVKRFQTALREMGFYDGELDSVYDLDVADAVRSFQGACNYPVDGVASPEIQQAAYYLLRQLEALFGEDNLPQPEMVREEWQMARLKSDANIIIRSKPDTKSADLGKLRNGDTMILNAVKDDWASITVNGVDGFVLKKYLVPFTQDNVIVRFTAADGAETHIGHTIAEYKAGAKGFAEEFAPIYASGQFAGSAEEAAVYASVNTGSDDIQLNLRAAPDGAATVLLQVPNGTRLRVLARADGFTRVAYNDKIGYLMDDYLLFSEGTPEDARMDDMSDAEAAEGESSFALVISSDASRRANVYDSGSADAVALGSLPAGTQVEVLDMGEGDDWVHIRYENHEGYMMETNLQFQLM